MATHRKTRQQKIQATQKRSDVTDQSSVIATSSIETSPPPAILTEVDEYAYVIQDLKRITGISLICFALLVLITMMLSEFSIFDQIRQTLHLPNLF